MKFSIESFDDGFIKEITPLLKEHYDEISFVKGKYPLQPNMELYKESYDKGILKLFTGRDDTGDLVAYAIFIVYPSLHYMSMLQAVQDVIFIRKESRGVGSEFISWCDDRLTEIGVDSVLHHVKRKFNFGPKILEPMGYNLVDYIYQKFL